MEGLPRLSAQTALFLDFDGTLAPLQDNPDTVSLLPQTASALQRASALVGKAVCIISGRDIRDLSKRVPSHFWRAGGHGLEVCAPGEEPAVSPKCAPFELASSVKAAVDGLSGVRIETKGPVFAIHYRQAPEQGETLLSNLKSAIAGVEGYKLQSGKMVIEVKPDTANKGRALEQLMQQTPFVGRTPLMVGDDTTDEDAFIAANALGGTSIKVGEGATAAHHRLGSPQHVAEWLSRQEQA